MTTTELINLLNADRLVNGDRELFDTNGYPIIGISSDDDTPDELNIESEF
jgi:hypothetical protein